MDLNKRVQCGILLVSGQYSSVHNTPEESAGLRSQPRLLIRIITSETLEKKFSEIQKNPYKSGKHLSEIRRVLFVYSCCLEAKGYK